MGNKKDFIFLHNIIIKANNIILYNIVISAGGCCIVCRRLRDYKVHTKI